MPNISRRALKPILLLIAVALLLTFSPLIEIVGAAYSIGDSSVDGLDHQYGRKLFFGENQEYYVIFHCDGSNMVYQTSKDSVTWSSATSLRSASFGSWFYAWYENRAGSDYFHYCFYDEAYGGTILYRRGTLQSDGTITWDAERIAYTYAAEKRGWVCGVSVDTNGYPFIMFAEQSDVSTKWLTVTKSSTNDGTWTTDSGFPFNVTSATSSTTRSGQIIPLTAAKMYAIWAGMNLQVEGRLWDSSWQSVETVSSSQAYIFTGWSVTSDPALDDNIQLTFLDSDQDIIYMNRTGSGWGDEYELADNSLQGFPTITRDGDDLYVWWRSWPDTDKLLIKKRLYGLWQTTTLFADDPSAIQLDSLQSFPKVYANRWGLVWIRAASQLYCLFSGILFKGAYDEFGDFDPAGVNVTCYFADTNPESFSLDGTYFYTPPSTPSAFYFDLGYNESRVYYYLQEAEIYVFLPSEPFYSYYFSVVDFVGVTNGYLESLISVNGSEMVVERWKLDVLNDIPFTFSWGHAYRLRLVCDQGTHTFGTFIAEASSEFQLVITNDLFPVSETDLGDISISVSRPELNQIQVIYADVASRTNWVWIGIYEGFSDSTVKTKNETSTPDSFTWSWSEASTYTNYRVNVTLSHEVRGTLFFSYTLPGETGIIEENPWNKLSFLGTLPFPVNQLVGLGMILLVFASFNQENAHVGMVVAVLVAMAFTAIGWLQIPWAWLVLTLAVAILAGLSMVRKRSEAMGI